MAEYQHHFDHNTISNFPLYKLRYNLWLKLINYCLLDLDLLRNLLALNTMVCFYRFILIHYWSDILKCLYRSILLITNEISLCIGRSLNHKLLRHLIHISNRISQTLGLLNYWRTESWRWNHILLWYLIITSWFSRWDNSLLLLLENE